MGARVESEWRRAEDTILSEVDGMVREVLEAPSMLKVCSAVPDAALVSSLRVLLLMPGGGCCVQHVSDLQRCEQNSNSSCLANINVRNSERIWKFRRTPLPAKPPAPEACSISLMRRLDWVSLLTNQPDSPRILSAALQPPPVHFSTRGSSLVTHPAFIIHFD